MDIKNLRRHLEEIVDQVNSEKQVLEINLTQKEQRNVSINAINVNKPTLLINTQTKTKNYYVGIGTPTAKIEKKKDIIKLLEPYTDKQTFKEAWNKFNKPITSKGGDAQDIKIDISYQDIEKVIYSYAGIKNKKMKIEFYPDNESEFKNECSNSGKLLWVIYKGNDVFYHYSSNTKGNFNSPLKSYLRALWKDSKHITTIDGVTKLRAFASNEYLQQEGSETEKILFEEGFYFEKIKPLLNDFANYDIADDTVEEIINFIDKKTKLQDVFAKFSTDKDFITLLAKIIATSDTKAADKNIYNIYDDKRTIGAGLNQPQWMKGFLKYKLDQDDIEGNLENLIDYVNNPSQNINVLSKEHRNNISQQLLKRNYDINFVTDLKEYFHKNEIYFATEKKDNETHLMAKVLYGPLKSKWNSKAAKGKGSTEDNMNTPLNQILYGPPGTGKTYSTVDKALEILEPNLDKDKRKKLGIESIKQLQDKYGSQIEFVTFHQSFSYEDFVEGIKAEDNGERLTYKPKPGIFKTICANAEDNYTNANSKEKDLIVRHEFDVKLEKLKKYVLIIDEINRGNISRIFGELITLIEPSKRIGNDEPLEVQLPYSKEPFGVPNNLHIIGTMNTADRSLANIDIALRRRFRFEEMPPDYELEKINRTVDGIDLSELLKAINYRICQLRDREHQIGHSFFMRVTDFPSLKEVFQYEILPLLEEYFFDDWDKIKQVLNDTKTHAFYSQSDFGDYTISDADNTLFERGDISKLNKKYFIHIYHTEPKLADNQNDNQDNLDDN